MSDDEDFLSQFEATTLPRTDWHHRQHIRAAYLYLCRYPLDEAADRMRSGIRAYNAAHGTPDALTSGYHETITQAWLRLVYVILCEYGAYGGADEFIDAHPQLLSLKSLRFFYSKDRLVTFEAKATFVEPDLAPLPKPRMPKI